MVKPCKPLKRRPKLLKVPLKQGQNIDNMVITHEQGVLTRFLRLERLKEFWFKFREFWRYG
jgi:hypothetical protein